MLCEEDDPRAWGHIGRGVLLLLAAMAGLAWVFGNVTWLYLAAEEGRWVGGLGELRHASWRGAAGVGVTACLAVSAAYACRAVVGSRGRARSAGLALLLASALPLAIWAVFTVEFITGTDILGWR